MARSSGNAAPREDPGWRKAVLAQLFPIGSRKTQRELDGLTVTRVLFVALVQAAFAGGLILVIITRTMGELDTFLAAVLLVLGAIGVATGLMLRGKPLATDNAVALAQSFRKRFFVGFAASEVPMLAGLVIGMIRQELWPYLITLPFFVAGMIVSAPSRSNIDRAQTAIALSGSGLLLRDELMSTQPPPS
ncbi:MAG: hypothetical protein QOH26_180 [Actinomycetota bacterium]|nr:hypothetical protein [Actinomycetota bacterium]